MIGEDVKGEITMKEFVQQPPAEKGGPPCKFRELKKTFGLLSTY
jgi:hypothetical protein